MKISELIARLDELKTEHGDVDTILAGECTEIWDVEALNITVMERPDDISIFIYVG
jgi:hypothetical protein